MTSPSPDKTLYASSGPYYPSPDGAEYGSPEYSADAEMILYNTLSDWARNLEDRFGPDEIEEFEERKTFGQELHQWGLVAQLYTLLVPALLYAKVFGPNPQSRLLNAFANTAEGLADLKDKVEEQRHEKIIAAAFEDPEITDRELIEAIPSVFRNRHVQAVIENTDFDWLPKRRLNAIFQEAVTHSAPIPPEIKKDTHYPTARIKPPETPEL